VCDNADSHELLSVVASVHHEGVGKTLNDGALCLAESLDGVLSCGVGEVHWCADVDVVATKRRPVSSVHDFFAAFFVLISFQCLAARNSSGNFSDLFLRAADCLSREASKGSPTSKRYP